MPTQDDFTVIFETLKRILQEYEGRVVITADTPENYSLNTQFSKKFNKELFFAAVSIKKNYVSYHLMPVYMYPDLLAGLSAGLRKRMQGKSCFNFKSIDGELFTELARLTRQSAERARAENIV